MLCCHERGFVPILRNGRHVFYHHEQGLQSCVPVASAPYRPISMVEPARAGGRTDGQTDRRTRAHVGMGQVAEKRDYLKGRNKAGWLYLARLAALKEFAFMQAL